MARFYGRLNNGRAERTQPGNASYGITGCVESYHVGVKIVAGTDQNDQNTFRIYITDGTSGPGNDTFFHQITETPDGPKVTG